MHKKYVPFAAVLAVASGAAHAQELEEIVVTSVPYRASQSTLSQSTSVLTGPELDTQLEGTIGETLSGEPGVSSTFFGPGASRPVIRGLGGDRVEVLIGGLGSIDASTVSPDHTVAGQSLSVESVEVVRGPSTLLYGPSAIGGVVNIIDGRIPSEMPADTVNGAARAFYGTNAKERAVAGSATVGLNRHLAGYADGSYRKSGDYGVPKGALDHEDETTVPNSAVKAKTGNVGLSWIGDAGYLGFSLNRNESRYGVPGHAEHGSEPGHAEEGVGIDQDQTRLDVRGELDKEIAIFETAKLRLSWADYEHAEMEGAEIGTVFKNNGWQGRIELVQRETDGLTGAMGIQTKHRDFSAIGEEAFTPPSKTNQWGVFAVEEYRLGDFLLQGGLRLDRMRIAPETAGPNRRFTNIGASLGTVWTVTDTLSFTVFGSRTERSPTAEELYSDGPHLATAGYEQGNPNLGEETAYGIEGGIRYNSARWSVTGQIYYTRYQDFIRVGETGNVEDGLPVRQYAQADARFHGFELETEYLLFDRPAGDLSIRFQADKVIASLVDSDTPLPRIPPLSAAVGADYRSARWDAGVELAFTDAQTRVAPLETATDDHVFVNGHLAWRPVPARADMALTLRARNLFNTVGRNHVSFLKDEAPLPGRDIRIGVNWTF